MYRILFILILMNNLTFSTQSQCQTQIFKVDTPECKIFYEVCDHNSKNQQLKFIGCQMKTCKKKSSSDQCQQYQYDYFPQTTCMIQCCQFPQNIIFTLQTLSTCKKIPESNNQSNKLILGLGLGLGLGLPFLICIICVVRCYLKYRGFKNFLQQIVQNNRQNESDCNVRQNPYFQSNRQNNIQQDKFKQLQPISTLSRQQLARRCQQILANQCSICLDECTNCQTSCRHYFHYKCIKQWSSKRDTCPICVRKQFNLVKIVCQVCKKHVFTYQIKLNRGQYYFNRQKEAFWNKNLKISCKQCKNRQGKLQPLKN